MEYLTLAFLGFVAALTPGPDILYLIRQGICKGKKASFLASFGILTGNIIYLFLVAIGLNSIGKSIYFQGVVGFLGGVYLLRVAVLTFKEEVKINKSCDSLRGIEIFKEALLINLSNPKAMIFFAVVITPFMSKNILLSVISLYLGISFAFLLAAFLSSKAKVEERILNIANKIASLLFLYFAFKLFELAYFSLFK